MAAKKSITKNRTSELLRELMNEAESRITSPRETLTVFASATPVSARQTHRFAIKGNVGQDGTTSNHENASKLHVR